MTFRKLTVLGILSLLVAVPAAAQVFEAPSEVVPGLFDKAAETNAMRALNERLIGTEGGLRGEPMVVEASATERRQLADAPTNQGRMLVGVNLPVGHPVAFERIDLTKAAGTTRAVAGGTLRAARDGFAWWSTIQVPGATATRLHLSEFSLPTGAALYVYNNHGEAFGPYTDKGVMGTGDFWTNTIAGSELRMQVVYEGENVDRAMRASRFVVAEAVHLGENFLYAKVNHPAATGLDGPNGKAFCSFNASCVNNASCSSIPSAIQSVRNAVAHLQFPVGSQTFICSGGLMNDTDSSSTIPYFLTANHCFSSQASANGLEAFFQFSTNCGGSCFNPDGTSPRVLGATILANSANSDFNFLRLNGNAPAGSTMLGWTNSAVAFSNNTNLFRISHPKGAPQAYSTQRVSTSAGTCGTLPRGNFIYSRDTSGATEGGSSGSPVVNSSGQVVGQLFGACGTNLGNVCDSGSNATVDGAFAATFSSVQQFLDPSTSNPNSCSGICGSQAPGGCWCDDACVRFGDCCSDKLQICGS